MSELARLLDEDGDWPEELLGKALEEAPNRIAPQLEALKVSVGSLELDEKNARTHDETNLDAIKASLARFGQRIPIVVQRKGPRLVVRAGNGRLKAARELGWTEIAAVVVDEADVDAIAFALADNRTAELAGWDDDVLRELVGALAKESEVPIGWSAEEVSALLTQEALLPTEVVEDEVPEPPEQPTTKRGQLWALGPHLVLCGDATEADDVARVMAGKSADLLVTDPPYNVDYTGRAGKIENDSMADENFRQFLVSAFGLAFTALKPGAAFYIWHADSEGYNFRGAVRDCNERVRQCLIWKKHSLVLGRQDYQWQHEPCLYGWKEGARHGWFSDRKQTTVLDFNRPMRSDNHPTMKPVALIAYLIGNSTAPQNLVLDPFLGSGTTLVAAEQLGRTCRGIELSPRYVDVIIKRWENLTGRRAKLVE